ncbi:MFS transporter [Rhodobacteraceae bacterium RKSG542]|uniref:MFS transporter n=1 Tax=Pseudovibrio flavus TaxID=2529854 RepID=UPI0012BB5DFA|nr:MFS transporter [Pseudovibrio flavus]MTI16733.1 MFS transporter [Pseudovibrio flavus]
MNLFEFIGKNLRWIGGGFLLMFAGGAGQGYLLGLFSPQIRATYGLSHGDFGLLFMVVTLVSAACLMYLGRYTDRFRPVHSAVVCLAFLSLGTFGMSLEAGFAFFCVSLFVVRLCGQGMLPLVAQTAMARWYNASRGKALSAITMGHMFGEATIPFSLALVLLTVDWRTIFFAVSMALLLVILPAVFVLLRKDRTPENLIVSTHAGPSPVSWTLKQALRDWRFWSVLLVANLLPLCFAPLLFHQGHFAEVKGWAIYALPAALPFYGVASAISSLVCGLLVDRFTAINVFPLNAVPLAIAMSLLAMCDTTFSLIIGLLFAGMSFGFWGSSSTAIFAEMYGTAHIGSIRSVVSVSTVLSSALPPAVVGILIDRGIGIELQFFWLSGLCAVSAAFLFCVLPKLRQQYGPEGSGPVKS